MPVGKRQIGTVRIMGTQFWWFFDAASAAIILVSVFLSGKKGFAKTIAVTIGWIIAMVFAFPSSGGAADFIYKNGVKQSNVSAIESALEHGNIIQKIKSYIEGLGYSVTVDEERLENIFNDSKDADVCGRLYEYVNNINGRVVDSEDNFRAKMTEGFAEIMNVILQEELSGYEADAVSEKILNGDSFENDLGLICGEDVHTAAEHIEEAYTADSTKDIIRIFCFIIIIFVLMTAVKIIAQKLSDGDAVPTIGDIADHAVGGILGAAEGIAIIFISAAVVRALVILGSKDMMLFNSDTIDKTIFFKHIYNLVLKL